MQNEPMAGIVSVVDGKLKIDNRIFDVDQLLEAKAFIQSQRYPELVFAAENDDDVKELHLLTLKMSELSPEAVDDEVQSYMLN